MPRPFFLKVSLLLGNELVFDHLFVNALLNGNELAAFLFNNASTSQLLSVGDVLFQETAVSGVQYLNDEKQGGLTA